MRPPSTRRDPVPLLWYRYPFLHFQVLKEVPLMSGFIFLAAGLIASRLALAYGSTAQPNYPHKFLITFTKEK